MFVENEFYRRFCGSLRCRICEPRFLFQEGKQIAVGEIEPLSVTELSTAIINTSIIEVSWKSGAGSEQNHFEVKYNVQGGNEKSVNKNHGTGDMTTQTVQIQQLTPGETYQISVHAVSNSVPGDAMTTSQNTKPAQVKTLQASAQGTSTVTLTWTVDANGIQKGFELRYKGRAQSVSYTLVKPDPAGTDLTATVNNLFPGDEYTFELTAYSGVQNTKSDPITAKAVLEPLNPTPVWEKLEATVNTATFSWTYDGTTYHAQQFSLKLFKKGSTTVVKEATVQGNGALKHTFTVLESGQKYTLNIYTLTYENKNNTSPGTEDATVRPEITSTLTEDSTTDTTMIISYTPTTTIFEKYIFSINDQQGTVVEKVSTDANTVSFSGLTPGELYAIAAKTKSGELLSQPTEINVLTNPRPPRLSCYEEPLSITLTLSAPEVGANKDFYTYHTNCVKCPNGIRIGGAGPEPFKSLDPFKHFIFRSRAKFEQNKGQMTFSKESPEVVITCQTKEAAPEIIERLEIEVRKPTEVSLHWSEPTVTGGKILGYYITYKGQTHESSIQKIIHIHGDSTFTHVISNLKAGSKYIFHIWSYNAVGNSTQIRQSSVTLPNSVIQKISSVQSTNVTLLFNNEFIKKNTTVLSYSVYVLTKIGPSPDELAAVYTWADVQDQRPQPPYVAIYKCANFFTLGNKCAITFRTKRNNFNQVNVTIGEDNTCSRNQKDKYCNGPLKQNTRYYFLLRLHFGTNNQTYVSQAVQTGTDKYLTNETEQWTSPTIIGNNETAQGTSSTIIGIAVAVAVVVIVIIVIVIIAVILRKRRLAQSKPATTRTTSGSNINEGKQNTPSTYEDLDLYNVIEDKTYEGLDKKDQLQTPYAGHYDALQVSSFKGDGSDTYYNKSEGMYYNKQVIKPESEHDNDVHVPAYEDVNKI